MTITEGNKLIAEFMGKKTTQIVYEKNESITIDCALEYHSSWGWQIPAWSKAIQEYDLPRKSVYKTRYAVATAINDTMLGFKILIELITEINQNNQP